MPILKEAYPLLFVLWKGNANTFESLVNDNSFSTLLLKSLKEICHNLLYTELPLTNAERKDLRKIKGLIISLSEGGVASQSSQKSKKLILLKNRSQLRKILKSVFVSLKGIHNAF